jgi:pimeloyl-ACP methyl ester carboxylesterase
VRALLPLVLLAAGCASTGPAPGAPIEGTTPSFDGVPIAWEDRGRGEPAIVLVHGWRCDRQFWRFTAPELAQARRVVSIDVAGHGGSGAGRGEWNIRALAEDVRAVVEARGLGRVVLVGHSMGGPVCLDAAALMPGRVVAVVGIDTLHDAEFVWPREQIDRAIASLEAEPEATMRGFIPTMLGTGVDPGLAGWIVARGMRADHAGASALMRCFRDLDLRPLMSAAGVPVRCLNAAPDPAKGRQPTKVDVNRRYADFDAVLLEGVGHYPMVERPASFTARLREVIEALPR